MKTLKLEVGKTYQNRKGEEVRIVEKNNTTEYLYRGSDDEWYTESGRWRDFGSEDPEDLIEEVPETRHTFQIPDGVKELTVQQVDNRIVVEMVPEVKEPKPGDVCINDSGSVYIFKAIYCDLWHNHFAWLGEDRALRSGSWCSPGRPATPEEAQPLFDALKKAGKRWNAETMQVEDVPEVERILEWVKEYWYDGHYTDEDVAEAIEAYLKHKEGEK